MKHEAIKYNARRVCKLCKRTIMPLEMYYKRPGGTVHVACARRALDEEAKRTVLKLGTGTVTINTDTDEVEE